MKIISKILKSTLQAAIPRMAEGVMKVTRLLANNPRKMTVKDAEQIYQKAW